MKNNADKIIKVVLAVQFQAPWGEIKELAFKIRSDHVIDKQLRRAIDDTISQWCAANNPLLKVKQ